MVKEAGLNPGEMVAIFPQASAEQDSSFYYAKQQFEKSSEKIWWVQKKAVPLHPQTKGLRPKTWCLSSVGRASD